MRSVRFHSELVVAEARAFAQSERGKVLSDLRKKMATEKTKAVEETKKKQWVRSLGRRVAGGTFRNVPERSASRVLENSRTCTT